MWENHFIRPFPKLLFHHPHSHYVQRVHYFHKAHLENMIDCFAMFPSPPRSLSLSADSSNLLADGFIKPYERQAKINGHAVQIIFRYEAST